MTTFAKWFAKSLIDEMKIGDFPKYIQDEIGRDGTVSTKVVELFFQSLSPDERMNLLSELGAIFCCHCGYDQPDNIRGCQYWNDE